MIEERAVKGPSAQQQAVMDHALGGPAIVDAGAGTGKTYTIVERVARLQEDPHANCPASSILLLTFSRKAAAELRGRIIRRLGPGVDPPECATFHAFALSILKEHSFELDLSPDATLVNEIDARVEFWKAFDEFVRGPEGADGSSFALRYWLVDEVRSSLFQIRQQLRDEGVPIDDFRRRALAAADAFATTPYRSLREEPGRSGAKLVCDIDDADFAREIAEERARVEAAAALFRRFDERLHARHALTYADLLDRAEAAVRARPEIAAALRARFAHCIVDEYQDTDPRQVRLLSAIFGDRLERVMVVGDPRQSIYGFRGARAGNVGDFARLPACVPYALTENRRSRQEILDLAHTVIGRHFVADEVPLRAVRGAAGAPVVHAASRWAPRGHKPPNAAETRTIEARWVVAKILELLAGGRTVARYDATGVREPLSPRHIAILSRRKTKLQPLIEALNDAGLPFRQYGGAGFYDAPEVLDAMAWIRLVADPLDDNALARVLSSPAIGVADATIAALCKGMKEDGGRLSSRALLEPLPADLDADGRRRIERLRSVLDGLEAHAGASLTVAWEATLDRAGLLLTADVRAGHRHDQARANLEKLSAMVRAHAERNPGAQASDFVRYMRELDRAEAEDQEADPPSADAINVMTIHAAKGLEWPIVFLIDVWPPDVADQRRVRIDPTTGALLVSEGPNGRKPFHTECIDRQDNGGGFVPREKDKEKDPEGAREERRLFYVGLTRARDELFVSGGRSHSRKDAIEGRPHEFLAETIAWIEGRGWPTIDEPAPRGLQLAIGLRIGDAAPFPLADFVRDDRKRPAVIVPTLSFSSVAQYEKCPRSVNYRLAYHLPGLAAPPSAETQKSGGAVDLHGRPATETQRSRGAVDLHGRPATTADDDRSADSLLSLGAYGELVHAALELWGRKPGDPAASYVAAAIRRLEVKPSTSETARAARMVDTVVKAFAGWRPVLVEAPFTLDFDGIALTGFIDLVATDPAGRAFVVDYKTGTTPAVQYALQLALYRKAAAEAYGIDVAGCRIARVTDDRCVPEEVALPDESELATRIAAVARGIRTADLTPKNGPHCAACGYRAAPCMDYARGG